MNASTANAGIWAIYGYFFNRAYACTVLKVEFADSLSYKWNEVEESVEPQPAIAAYPEHADEYRFKVLLTSQVDGDAKLQYSRDGGQVTDVTWNGAEPDIEFSNGELNYQIILLEGSGATPVAETNVENVIKVRNMRDGDQFVAAMKTYPEVKGTARVVKNFSWLDEQAIGQNAIFFGTELGSIPESIKSNIKNTIAYALSQAVNSEQSQEREAIEVQMATVYAGPPPLLAALDVPSSRGIGEFPEDLYHLHITYLDALPQAVQQAVVAYEQAIANQKSSLGIDASTTYLIKDDRDKFWQLYTATAGNLVNLLSVVNGPAVFIYHSYESVGEDYIDPAGQTGMRFGDPIRNMRTDLADNDPDLIYPGDPNKASEVYNYLSLVHAIQLSFIVHKDGKILLFESDSRMTKALQLRQAFGE